jgi:hypothetical protein
MFKDRKSFKERTRYKEFERKQNRTEPNRNGSLEFQPLKTGGNMSIDISFSRKEMMSEDKGLRLLSLIS